MSDEPDRQDLEDRVEQLESTIDKMLPGRRDALKLGGAALLGGAAMSGNASAGTQQAGTIGTANDPVDVESEDINNADTVTTATLNAENAVVSGPGKNWDLQHIARTTDTSSTFFDFSLPGDYSRYLVDYTYADAGTSGRFNLRFAGDGPTNNLYQYFDQTGSKTTGQSTIPLIDHTVFYEGDGQIWINENGFRIGINHQPGGRISQVNQYATIGGRDARDTPLSSVQFFTPSLNQFELDIWGVISR